jgi:tetratricopeptide (TPR) repeat protein
MRTSQSTRHIFLGLLFLALANCQKKPALSPAGVNLSTLEPPPMGATNYNDEFIRDLAILDNILNSVIGRQRLRKIHDNLSDFYKKNKAKDRNQEDIHLGRILIVMPELLQQKKPFNDREKEWLRAKFHFLNRRHVEASMLMSAILQKNDDDLVRSWRSRAIFFLGNPDLARSELKAVISRSGETSPQGLDALYLLGAMSYEDDERDKKHLNAGIDAWTRYLKLVDADSAMIKEIEQGLAELKRRLQGDLDNQGIYKDRFLPNDTYKESKNAILAAFAKEELLLAQRLAQESLKVAYDPDIATIKARILFKNGQIDEALTLFMSITEKDKKYAPGFHYRGMAFMLQGKRRDAILSWQRTLEIDETYGSFHDLKRRIAVAEKMEQESQPK